MTDEEKKNRKERIQQTAEAKLKPRAREMSYWITRDQTVDGKLSGVVDVWLIRPERIALEGGGAYWRVPGGEEVFVQSGEGPKPARFATWPLSTLPTIPDDSIQCIRYGFDDEPVILPPAS